MNILLMRHGQTTNNVNRIIDGQTGNGQLTDFGKEQAFNRGIDLIKSEVKIDAIFTSDLDRAIDTAALVLQGYDDLSIPIISDSRLKEINMGSKEGKHMPPRFIGNTATWIMRGLFIPFAKGGESHGEVIERVKDFHKDILIDNDSSILIVTHDLPMGLLGQELNNNMPIVSPGAEKIGNSEIWCFDTNNRDEPFVGILRASAQDRIAAANL